MNHSVFDLSGTVALVTGSSRGIGLTLARSLLRAGAGVVLHGRDPDRLAQTAAQVRAEFPASVITSAEFDVTDESAVRRGVALVMESRGVIDILINNAGVQHREPLLEVSLDDWRRVIDTNLTSAFLVGREVARQMVRAGRGKIVNICSVQSEFARATIAPYTAAKGGLRNLTRAMAAEWSAHDIQVNGIALGYIHTELTQTLVDDPSFNAWVLGRTPAGRWGSPEDLAGPVVMLASHASDFVTGQVLFVDGGMTAVV